MKVRCISTALTGEQIARFGSRFDVAQRFGLVAGAEYVVLGLVFAFGATARGTGPYVVVPIDQESVSTAPLSLFAVVDSSVPADWTLDVDQDEVTLLPPELASRYFFDDLSERRPKALDALRRALARS